MAQHTPNLDLVQPDATDTFEFFKESYNENMQKIDDASGGGGSANIVNCTQAEYDALPSSKESDNVLYIVYFDGGQTLDLDYSYYKYGDNDEIIVRVYHEGQSDQQTLWFFRGWNQTSGDMAIPSSLQAYAPSSTSIGVQSANYPDAPYTTQNGWIGFYNGNIRGWSTDFYNFYTGICHCVVDLNGSYYPNPQTNPYVDDPYVYIQDADATRRIYMNGREYAEFNSGGGGGGGSLDAVETTSNAYAQLPQIDKDDPTKIYFLNDTQSSEVETPVDFSTFYNRRESSMNIAVVNGELVYTWNGGSSIGGSSYYPTAIPANAKKIKFKITTGNSYSTTNNRFKIAIGVKSSYNTSAWATSEDNDWLAVDIQNTRNTVYEGEIDLSGVTVVSYLMIGAHGWTVTFNEISIVSDAEPTGNTEIRYKDVAYGKKSEIPDAPTTQGTYTLQATVDSGGNVTYSWV